MTMSAAIAINPHRKNRLLGRGSDPPRPLQPRGLATISAAAERSFEQLPAFAPLLEELELAGWSSQWRMLSGHFHDWMLLDRGRVMVMVGQATATELADPMETALAAQSAATALRAHAYHTTDAGHLLALAARTLGTNAAMTHHASVAVALVDGVGGSASLAIAGDCLAWRVRAAKCEQVLSDQPALGVETNFDYAAQDFALSLRERLLLVADHPNHRGPRLAATIAANFRHLDAESHRRMTAADATALVRRQFEEQIEENPLASASIIAVRRR
jgi:Stage II sporulation protein E (SpoIIE)